EVLHRAHDLAVLDQEETVARHPGIQQRLSLCRHAADVPELRDQQAASRLLDHLLDRHLRTRLHQAHVHVRRLRVAGEVLEDPVFDPGDRCRRLVVGEDRSLAQRLIADVALEREEWGEELVADLLAGHERSGAAGSAKSTAATTTATATGGPTASSRIASSAGRRSHRNSTPAAAATKAAAATAPTAAGVEDPGDEREEARIGAWLEDDGVAARLERLGVAALERLVGGRLGERLRINHMDVLDAGRARPS